MNENNHIPTDVEELESIENTYWAEQYKDLMDLYKMPQFQNVILKGYFEKKAIDQVSLLATPYVRENNLRPAIMEELNSISALESHFDVIKNLGAPMPEDEE